MPDYPPATARRLRIYIAAGVALLAVIGVLLATTMTPRADAATCHEEVRVASAHKNDGSTFDDEWWFHTRVRYNACDRGHRARPDRREYRDPISTKLTWNEEGPDMDCDGITSGNTLQFVWANEYLYDYQGHNYNPNGVKMKCRETSHGTTVIYHDPDGPRLWVVRDENGRHDPRARVYWRTVKGTPGPAYEVEAVTMVSLRRCSGVGLEEC